MYSCAIKSSWTSLTIFALFCAFSLAQTTDQCNNACASNQVCVNLGSGYQCSYRQCSDLVCPANSICINDGGVARCEAVAPAPTTAPTTAPDQCNSACASNQVCVNLGDGYECHYQSCSEIQCTASQVCINDGGVARCIDTSSSPNADAAAAPSIAPTTAPTSAADPCLDACTSSEVCVNLGQGYQCQPRLCSDLSCASNQVCIDDGGLARCINVSTPSSCVVAVSIEKRADGAYVDGGVNAQIYDLVFTNTGSSAVFELSVTITPSGTDSVSQMWNMSPAGANTYSVAFYNTLPSANSQYFGAGFILSGSTSQIAPIVVASPTC